MWPRRFPGWDFERVHAATVGLWNAELAKLKMSGETDSQRRQLYTAMYHIMADADGTRTGENPGWVSTEPYYDDYYAIWDTFRSSSPAVDADFAGQAAGYYPVVGGYLSAYGIYAGCAERQMTMGGRRVGRMRMLLWRMLTSRA